MNRLREFSRIQRTRPLTLTESREQLEATKSAVDVPNSQRTAQTGTVSPLRRPARGSSHTPEMIWREAASREVERRGGNPDTCGDMRAFLERTASSR